MKNKLAAVVRKFSQLADQSPDIPALGELMSMMLHPFDHPRMLAYSFGVAVILGVSYFGPKTILRTLLHQQPVATKRGGRLRPPLGSIAER